MSAGNNFTLFETNLPQKDKRLMDLKSFFDYMNLFTDHKEDIEHIEHILKFLGEEK
jgi:hypothetical protein